MTCRPGLAEQEVGQVRVAARAPQDVLDQPRTGAGSAPSQDHLLDGPRIHPPQLQLGDRRHPERVGQPAVQPVALSQVGIAIGGQEAQPLAGDEPADQVGQGVQRARVGPLQVVEHDKRRPVCLQGVQDRPDLEQRDPRGRVVQGGHEVVQTAARSQAIPALARGGSQPVGQCLREGHVARHVRSEPKALTEQHVAAAVLGGPRSLANQARLADARLAVHQNQARLPENGKVHGRPQRRPFRLPTDQGRWPIHPTIIRPPASIVPCPEDFLRGTVTTPSRVGTAQRRTTTSERSRAACSARTRGRLSPHAPDTATPAFRSPRRHDRSGSADASHRRRTDHT